MFANRDACLLFGDVSLVGYNIGNFFQDPSRASLKPSHLALVAAGSSSRRTGNVVRTGDTIIGVIVEVAL